MSWPSTDFELEIQNELDRYKKALGLIAELGDRCEDCEPTTATTPPPMATHVTHGPFTGVPVFLCDACTVNARASFRKAESKGCGRQPSIDVHDQEPAVLIALAALLPSGDGEGA